MVKRKLYHRLLVLGIASSITISSAIVAFADSSKVTDSPKFKIEGKLKGSRRGEALRGDIKNSEKQNRLADVLTAQVTAGVITQAEADKVTSFLKTKEDARKVERDAQKAKLDAMTDEEKKIAMEARKAERVAERAKLAAMTAEERTAYMKANRPTKGGIFTELVTAGILTEDQAYKIQASVVQRPGKGKGQGRQQGETPTNEL